MHRFYSSSEDISDDKITISDIKQIHHMKDVLRIKINAKVIVFDNKGNAYLCGIKELSKNQAILEIKDKISKKTKNRIKITVACAIPKKSKMDDIIDKLTQLGVERIIPLKTKRVVVELDRKKESLRLNRWQKISQTASVQSRRNIIPIIEPIKDLNGLLSEANDFDLKLIPTLVGEQKSLNEVIKAKPKDVLILIGPEGDFTPEEVDLAKKSGCIPVSLGDLVLRVETAAIAIVSFIRLYENH
jgi:16S rRNA (uracil1498-N3)-methyltransferase